MKLPGVAVRLLLAAFGKIKQQTVMGEVLRKGLSDRGSTPLRSMYIFKFGGLVWQTKV